MIKKIYAWWCGILVSLWSVGLGATAISKFQYAHENEKLFWDFVLPYNEVIHFLSWIPVMPVLFFILLPESKKSKKSNLLHWLLFLVISALWIAYMSLYIHWTES